MVARVKKITFGPFFQMVKEDRPYEPVSCSDDVFRLFAKDAQSDREWLQALYMDPKNNILHLGLEAFGTTDSSAVYPREIAKRALAVSASAVIVVHNHPSGDPEPSLCDREITKDLAMGLHFLQIKMLDHIIIGAKIRGNQRFFSFADQGLMDDYILMNIGGR